MNFRSIFVFMTTLTTVSIFYWVSSSHPAIPRLGEFQEIQALPLSQSSFYSASGQSFQLSDFKGKLIILHSFASWCAPCIEEIPGMINFYKEIKDKNVVLIAIQREPLRDKIEFSDLPVYFDPDNRLIQEMNLIAGVPSTLFISPSGKAQLIVLGKALWESDAMNQKIEGLLKK